MYAYDICVFWNIPTVDSVTCLSKPTKMHTNSNYSFNFQYIEILSDQTLENSHSDILTRQILHFSKIDKIIRGLLSRPHFTCFQVLEPILTPSTIFL